MLHFMQRQGLRSCTGENRGNREFLAMGASLLCGAFAVHQMVSRCWAAPSTEDSSPASVCSVSSCSLLNGSPARDSDFLGARKSFRQLVDNGPLLRNKFLA